MEIEGDTLTISGVEGTAGRMGTYDYETYSPWQHAENIENVKKIIIDDTVTELSENAFNGKYKVDVMEIAGSVKVIPMLSIRGIHIQKLILHEGIETIDMISVFCRVKEVEIPKSVTSIAVSAFSVIADGNTSYLEKVYGYTGSEAEKFTNLYNKYTIQTRENGVSEEGSFFGLDWNYDGDYDEESLIGFIPLDDEGTPDTEITPDTETTPDANSGVDGEIAWKIEGDMLTLSAVEGTAGRMKDYDVNTNAPWQETDSIKNVKNSLLIIQ